VKVKKTVQLPPQPKMSRNHMTSERLSEAKFEIGHVLFIDIVGLLEVAD
jgi:hypothetical protein